MATGTVEKKETAICGPADGVVQFSVFTPNRLGRLHDVIGILGERGVHMLALTVLDTTDSSIIRFVVDDVDQARHLLEQHGFPFTEGPVLVVELDSAMQLPELMAAMLEVELNINYLYSFIPHPHGKSILALSMEDNDVAEKVLKNHQFRTLKQSDIAR